MTQEQTQEKLDTREPETGVAELFEELDSLAERLEDPATTLEDSFLLYQKGMKLLKTCSERLDTVEKKMLQLNEDGTTSEFSR